MISIISAVHNEIEFNKLFLSSLKKNTSRDYEVIIIDNHSTDGSADFFESEGCTVIRNPVNHCYPESQNIGMQHANGNYFCFLNNDIYLAPEWDIQVIDAMEKRQLDIASLDSFQTFEDPGERKKFHHRWRRVRKKTTFLFANEQELSGMIDRLYQQNFDLWALDRIKQKSTHHFAGINGSAVITSRALWSKLGDNWDEQIEAADWDLHIRVKQHIERHHDMHPPVIISSALHHHFAGVTFRKNPEPRNCNHTHLPLDEKWSQAEIEQFGPHLPEDKSMLHQVRAGIKQLGKMLSGKGNNRITGH